jgi:hypothetical protein
MENSEVTINLPCLKFNIPEESINFLKVKQNSRVKARLFSIVVKQKN